MYSRGGSGEDEWPGADGFRFSENASLEKCMKTSIPLPALHSPGNRSYKPCPPGPDKAWVRTSVSVLQRTLRADVDLGESAATICDFGQAGAYRLWPLPCRRAISESLHVEI